MTLTIGSRRVDLRNTGLVFDYLSSSDFRNTRSADGPDAPTRRRAVEAIRRTVNRSARPHSLTDRIEGLIDAFARTGWTPVSGGQSGLRSIDNRPPIIPGRAVVIAQTGELVIIDDSLIIRTEYDGTGPYDISAVFNREFAGGLEVRGENCERHPYLRRYWRCRYDPDSPLFAAAVSDEARLDALGGIQAKLEALGWVVEPFMARVVEGRSSPPHIDDGNPSLGEFPIGLYPAWDLIGWRTGSVKMPRVGVIDLGFREAASDGVKGWTRVVAEQHTAYRIEASTTAIPHSDSTRHGDICASLLRAPVEDAAWGDKKYAHGTAAGASFVLVEAGIGNRSDWQLSIALCAAAFGNTASGASGCDLISCSIGDSTGLGWTAGRVLLDALSAVSGVNDSGADIDGPALLRDDAPGIVGSRRSRPIFWAVSNSDDALAADDGVVSHPGVIAVRGADIVELWTGGVSNIGIGMIPGARGAGVDLAAPAARRGALFIRDGALGSADSSNSFATPLAAGVGALVLSVLPGISARGLKELLISTADARVIDQSDGRQVPLLDALSAVTRAASS